MENTNSITLPSRSRKLNKPTTRCLLALVLVAFVGAIVVGQEKIEIPKNSYGWDESMALRVVDMFGRSRAGFVGGREAIDLDKMSSLIEEEIGKSTMTAARKEAARKKSSKLLAEWKSVKWVPYSIELSRLDEQHIGMVAKEMATIDIGLGPKMALPSPRLGDFILITILEIVSDDSFLAMSVKDFETSKFLVEGMPTKRLGVGGKVTIPRFAKGEDAKKIGGIQRPVLHVFNEKEHAEIMEYCTKNEDKLIKTFEEFMKQIPALSAFNQQVVSQTGDGQ